MQASLAAEGMYDYEIDGVWGPRTETAIYAHITSLLGQPGLQDDYRSPEQVLQMLAHER